MIAVRSTVLAVAVVLSASAAGSAQEIATVTTDLNMRAGPGTGHPVITVIPGGTSVDVISCGAGWCDIAHAGRRGYVSESYLDTAYAGPPPPPIPPGYAPRPPYGPAPYPPGSPGYGRPPYQPYPPRYACNAAGARWAVGEFASRSVVERARQTARARTVRVVTPDGAYTMDYRDDRLNLEVSRRNIIRNVRCG